MNDTAVFTMVLRRMASQSLPPLTLDTMHAGAPTLGAETISIHDDSLLSILCNYEHASGSRVSLQGS